MKKITSLVILALTCICCTNLSEANTKGTNPQSKPVQTIHQFISHPEKHDLKGALAMLPAQDASFYKRTTMLYYNGEKSDIYIINSPWPGEQVDIANDSWWQSDTIRMYGNLYLSFSVPFKSDVGYDYPSEVLCFRFLLSNSDTLFDSFDYTNNPFNISYQESDRSNTAIWILHKFMGYLKNNKVKDAQAMLSIPSTNPAIAERYMSDEMTQMNHAQEALQQMDLPDDSTWDWDVSYSADHTYLSIYTAEKGERKPHFKSRFKFVFSIDNSIAQLSNFYYYR